MPIVTGKRRTEIYREILSGKRKVIVWGARDAYFLNRWQALLPVTCIVDANWRIWDTVVDGLPVRSPSVLADEDPKRTALVSDYTNPKTLREIVEFVDKRSKLPILQPCGLPDIYRLMKQGGAHRNADKAYAEIARLTTPIITRPHPWRKVSPLTNPRALEKNAVLFGAYGLSDAMDHYLSSRPKDKVAHDPKKILLINPNLNLGGSQRQMMHLAVALKKDGYAPEFLVLSDNGPLAHYVEFLGKNDIPLRVLLPGSGDSFMQPCDINLTRDDLLDYIQKHLPPELQLLLWHMPQPFLLNIVSLYLYLKKHRFGLIIGYLDWSNVVGAMAGLMAGTPKIIVTGRNVYPGAFPHFFAADLPAMHQVYTAALRYPQVSFANNSHGGAESYAAWLGIKPKRIHVIPNCLPEEFRKIPPKTAIRDVRKSHGIDAEAPLVVGAMRFSPEKQPLTFLKVIADLRRKKPKLRALVCGSGAMEGEMRKFIHANGLEKCVILAPPTGNIRDVMAAADLFLLTSEAEGGPNVLLEAQAQAIAVVTTRAGGVETNLYPPFREHMHPIGDVKGLVRSCIALLDDEALRRRLGKAARAYVLKNFSGHMLAQRNLRLAAGKRI